MTMRKLFYLIFFLLFVQSAQAQLWSPVLEPTYGAGACTRLASGVPSRCAIDWTANSTQGTAGVGIPGGVPNRTTTCTTISAATYGNGSSDATAGINSALSSCGTAHSGDTNGSPGGVVVLGAGTFLIDGQLNVPSNVTLRGSGTQSTILNRELTGTYAGATVNLGTGTVSPSNSTAINSGATAGSTSLVVASASGISPGTLLLITELNDTSYVSIVSGQGSGNCTWCDLWSGTRNRVQVVEVQTVVGTTVTFSPPLYTAYSYTPLAAYFSESAKWAGVENLQIYANGTTNSGNGDAYASNVTLASCAYCWVKGVENNYSDGDHVQVRNSFRCEVRDSYFSNDFNHVAGQTDANVNLLIGTSGTLVENNIFERLHISMLAEWGAAGNVFAYNFSTGAYDTSAPNVTMMDYDGNHGSHPQFNLAEGNVVARMEDDAIWGSTSHNTWFRNWAWGTTYICSPAGSTRASYSCASGTWANQAVRAMEQPGIPYTNGTGAWWDNLIGNVVGSAPLAALGTEYTGGPSPCLACNVSPTTRGYQTSYDYSFGYGSAGDSTGACSSVATCPSYITTLLHGNYDHATSSVEVWASGVTHTLPASFYRSSKPAWWGNTIPWPAIGPDVTTGDGPGGHAYLTASNAAQACYNSMTVGSDGIRLFDPIVCYAVGSPGVAPATNLFAKAQ